ncbi:Z-ring formation inhibitor MciZ [Paenibacillus ginsengarvi]|uniref:Z-ring formation inhibitor MciZ n=1 Tax=Paenibacillus ginsengarvi TaxID=400777 RepID=A0A3B0CKX1_9BACL|nr:Z-ring formation inhibitor MciZ [Paenibacillus ginsengarvi]RKN84666.1 Z-ring formation inhibitor MciZ [Paenibacillus ginsengarvi]
MKSYITETQLRLVGKGWEIRRQLRDMNALAEGGRTPLAALLPALIRADDAATAPAAPPRKPNKKTPDRRVVPFPSS